MKKYHQKIDVRVRDGHITLPGTEYMQRDHTPYDFVFDFDEPWGTDGLRIAHLRIRFDGESDWTKAISFSGNVLTMEAPNFLPDDGRIYFKVSSGDLETDEGIVRVLPNMTCPNCGGIIVPDIGFFKPEVGKRYSAERSDQNG